MGSRFGPCGLDPRAERWSRSATVLVSASVLVAGVGVGPVTVHAARGWAVWSVGPTSRPMVRVRTPASTGPGVPVGVEAVSVPIGSPGSSSSSELSASSSVPSASVSTVGLAARAVPRGGTTSVATAAGGTYRVVGLGDSVPSGSGCACTGYVTLVTRAMATAAHQVPLVHNHARGGSTTAAVLAQLSQQTIRTEIADADLVLLTVGANDFDAGALTTPSCQPDPATTCYATTLARQRTRLTSILSRIHGLQAAHGGRAVVTGYWNVFLDGDVAQDQGARYVRDSRLLTRAENAQIAAVSTRTGARYVDIAAAFQAAGDVTALLAADGDHPNAAGHALIARTVIASLT